MEKALLVVHHPFKADQGLPRSVALKAQEARLEGASLSCCFTSARAMVGNGWLMLEMLWSLCCWRTVSCVLQ